MTWKGRSIWRVRTAASGIEYSDAYARAAAARWAGFRTVEELETLDEDAYARLIAEYETAQQIAAIMAQDAIDRAKQQS